MKGKSVGKRQVCKNKGSKPKSKSKGEHKAVAAILPPKDRITEAVAFGGVSGVQEEGSRPSVSDTSKHAEKGMPKDKSSSVMVSTDEASSHGSKVEELMVVQPKVVSPDKKGKAKKPTAPVKKDRSMLVFGKRESRAHVLLRLRREIKKQEKMIQELTELRGAVKQAPKAEARPKATAKCSTSSSNQGGFASMDVDIATTNDYKIRVFFKFFCCGVVVVWFQHHKNNEEAFMKWDFDKLREGGNDACKQWHIHFVARRRGSDGEPMPQKQGNRFGWRTFVIVTCDKGKTSSGRLAAVRKMLSVVAANQKKPNYDWPKEFGQPKDLTRKNESLDSFLIDDDVFALFYAANSGNNIADLLKSDDVVHMWFSNVERGRHVIIDKLNLVDPVEDADHNGSMAPGFHLPPEELDDSNGAPHAEMDVGIHEESDDEDDEDEDSVDEADRFLLEDGVNHDGSDEESFDDCSDDDDNDCDLSECDDNEEEDDLEDEGIASGNDTDSDSGSVVDEAEN